MMYLEVYKVHCNISYLYNNGFVDYKDVYKKVNNQVRKKKR